MDKDESKTIFFDEEAKYCLGDTTYVVISHFQDKGEDIMNKISRLLKLDIQNTVNQNI